MSRLCFIRIVIFVQLEFTGSDLNLSLCTNTDFVGVSKPWDFRFGSDIRQSENRHYIMMSETYKITCCGVVVGWEFHASFRAQIRPITLSLWRPVQSTSDVFTLIGQTSVWYTKEKSQTVTVKLNEQEYLYVKHGDLIGWHAPSGDVIDYRTTTNEISSGFSMALNILDMPVGTNYSIFDSKYTGRIYAIKAILASAQPPRFVNLSHKITLKCPLEDNHYITTIEVSDGNKVRYNIAGYSPWFSVDEITGEVRTISSLNGNLTCDITIVATAACDVRASIVLPFQCIDLTETMEEKVVSATQATLTSANTKPRLLGLPAYITVLENMSLSEVVYKVTFADADGDQIALRYYSEDGKQSLLLLSMSQVVRSE